MVRIIFARLVSLASLVAVYDQSIGVNGVLFLRLAFLAALLVVVLSLLARLTLNLQLASSNGGYICGQIEY